jgi:hypothetical protein
MRHFAIAALFSCAAGLAATATASPPHKMDPTGTWEWTIDANGHRTVTTLRLKLEGDQLTGVSIRPNDPATPIEDAKYGDGMISFKVVDRRSTSKDRYSGKLKGDTITGSRKFDVGSQAFTFKRVKEP